MSDDRHSNGTFNHLSGASSYEQSKYGVNAHDSEHTARGKVLYGQSQETSTHVGEPFSVGTRRFFFVCIALIVIVVGGLGGAKYWQELGLKTRVYYAGAVYFESFETAEQRKRVHVYVLERIKPLYRDNAPLARIFPIARMVPAASGRMGGHTTPSRNTPLIRRVTSRRYAMSRRRLATPTALPGKIGRENGGSARTRHIANS